MPRATLCRRHTPAGIPPRVLTGLVLAFACLTVLRGYGWVTADPGVSLSLVMMVGLHDTTSRGIAVMAAGGLVLAAYASRRHVAVFLAHGLAAATYAALTASITTAVLAAGSGWQHVTPMLGGVAWHLLLAWLNGPLPSQAGRTPRDTD